MGNIAFERHDGVAPSAIDRPDKLNALTLAMYDELAAAFDEVRDDDRIGVAILTGRRRPRVLRRRRSRRVDPGPGRRGGSTSRAWDGAHQKHTRLFKPVDRRGQRPLPRRRLRDHAVDRPHGSRPTTRSSASPRPASASSLPAALWPDWRRQIPYAWAMELMLLGSRSTPRPHCATGCSTGWSPQERCWTRPLALARRLLARSGTALEVIKSSVIQLADMPSDAAFHAEALFGQKAFDSAMRAKGLAAFAERRTPQFPSRAQIGAHGHDLPDEQESTSTCGGTVTTSRISGFKDLSIEERRATGGRAARA